ncbi:hypothetical protein Tco_1407160 [Tanacetum coccineum]
MTGPVTGGDQEDREESPPLTKEQIEGHISALKSIIKDRNKKNAVNPIRLDFGEDDTEVRDNIIVKGKGWWTTISKNPLRKLLEPPSLEGS